MFSSRLNVFLPAHSCPSIGHPACPEPGRERGAGSVFPRPSPAGGNLPFAHSLPSFSTATLVGPHRKTHNPNLLIRLLHNSLDTPGGESVLASSPLFTSSRRSVSFPHEWPAPVPEQASTANPCRMRTYAENARNPFRIRTSKTKDLKPFRMNTYRKMGGGVPSRRSPVYRLTASYCVSPRHPS
jgi:hypothetical protein